MNAMIRSARLLAVLSLVAAAPATRPAANAASERIVSKSRGLEFRVPKPWEPSTSVRIPAELSDQVFYFQLPGTGPRKTATKGPPPAPPAELSVGVTEPCERQEHLTNVVDDMRKAMTNDTRKIVDDRAVEIDGKPGWLLEWDYDIETKRITVKSDGTRKETPGPTHKMRRRHVMFIFNRSICDTRLVAERTQFDRLSPHLDQIAASIAIVEPKAVP